MHGTLSRENIVLSVIKFFTDNLTSAPITYDTWFELMEGHEKWYSVNFGDFDFENKMAQFDLTIICLSNGNYENYELASHVDDLMDVIISDEDNKLSVDLYDTSSEPWVKCGGMSFFVQGQPSEDRLEDGTKYVLVDIFVKWGTML